MAKIVQYKSGRWGIDITVNKRRYRMVVGDTREEAETVIMDFKRSRITRNILELKKHIQEINSRKLRRLWGDVKEGKATEKAT